MRIKELNDGDCFIVEGIKEFPRIKRTEDTGYYDCRNDFKEEETFLNNNIKVKRITKEKVAEILKVSVRDITDLITNKVDSYINKRLVLWNFTKRA